MLTHTIPNAYPAPTEGEFRAHDERNQDRDVLLIMPKVKIGSSYTAPSQDRKVVRSSQIVYKEKACEVKSSAGESLQLYNYTIKIGE